MVDRSRKEAMKKYNHPNFESSAEDRPSIDDSTSSSDSIVILRSPTTNKSIEAKNSKKQRLGLRVTTTATDFTASTGVRVVLDNLLLAIEYAARVPLQIVGLETSSIRWTAAFSGIIGDLRAARELFGIIEVIAVEAAIFVIWLRAARAILHGPVPSCLRGRGRALGKRRWGPLLINAIAVGVE